MLIYFDFKKDMQNSIFSVCGLSPTGTKGCAWAKLILNSFSYSHYTYKI